MLSYKGARGQTGRLAHDGNVVDPPRLAGPVYRHVSKRIGAVPDALLRPEGVCQYVPSIEGVDWDVWREFASTPSEDRLVVTEQNVAPEVGNGVALPELLGDQVFINSPGFWGG